MKSIRTQLAGVSLTRMAVWKTCALVGAGLGISACSVLKCSTNDPPDTAVDAGPDTRNGYIDRWAPDAADVGVCAPPGDDAGVVHDWPGFRRLSEIDPCCPFDVAQDLSLAVPYKWVACADTDGGGCQQLDIPFGPNGETPDLRTSMTRSTGGGGRLYLLRLSVPPDGADETIVYDIATGAVEGVWRLSNGPTNGRCNEAIIGSVDNKALMMVTLYPTALEHDALNRVAVGTIKSLSASPIAVHDLPNTGVDWGNMLPYSSTERLGLEYLNNNYKMLTCDLSGDAANPCVKVNLASVSALLLFDFIEGDTIFATSNYGTTGWEQEYVVDPKGTVSLFRSNPKAHIDGTCSDENTIVWTETYGSVNSSDPQALTEVWSAPFTSDPSTLASTAKKIAVLPKPSISNRVKCFNGYYAWARNDLYVVRLSDGAIVTGPNWFLKPKGDQLPLYVTSTEVWENVRGPVDDAGTFGYRLMRFTLPVWP